jgi:hypothetical protein
VKPSLRITTVCTFFITTLTFKLSIRSIAPVSASTKPPPTYVPAFACRMSSACVLQNSRQQRCAVFWVEQINDQRITAFPSLLHSAFNAASSRSTITTREPAASIASLLASPMPDAAPVTTATLPSSSFAIRLHLARVTAPHSIAIQLSCRGKDGPVFGAFHRHKPPARAVPSRLTTTFFFEERPQFAHSDLRRERLNVADRPQAEWGAGLEVSEEKRS